MTARLLLAAGRTALELLVAGLRPSEQKFEVPDPAGTVHVEQSLRREGRCGLALRIVETSDAKGRVANATIHVKLAEAEVALREPDDAALPEGYALIAFHSEFGFRIDVAGSSLGKRDHFAPLFVQSDHAQEVLRLAKAAVAACAPK